MRKVFEDLSLRNIEVVVEEEGPEHSQGCQEASEVQGVFSDVSKEVRDRFVKDSLKTADPLTLLLMCYDIAKASLKKAVEGIRTKNYELKYEGISKAMRVFDLLMATTEPNEVGRQLISSYLFITQKITEADIKKDADALEKVIGYIQELEDAWRKIKQR